MNEELKLNFCHVVFSAFLKIMKGRDPGKNRADWTKK
jgi:hypothetical protein